jgi:Domain of unknown function (DUF5666)
MNIRIRHGFLIGLSALWLAACGTSGSNDSSANTADSGQSANGGSSGCTDRSSAVGIEGGGIRRVLGAITSIGSDGTLVVGCVRILTADAVIIIDGQDATLSDLEVGQVVEVSGNIDPESGSIRAESISSKVVSQQISHGRYVGTVKIGDGQLFGDALLTEDGAIRLYVGGPYSSDGSIQTTKPAGSAQFVGAYDVNEGRATGSGVIIGQGCANPGAIRFCGESATGELTFVVDSDNIQGAIQVATNEGNETWSLDLRAWSNYYLLSAAPQYVAGQYQEELAEFAIDGDTIMNVDGEELSFQSSHSGCTGNGALAPHRDGAFNVYDVTVTIGNCNPPYSHLNGSFEGLATTSAGAYWDYDSWLRMWLSKEDGTQSQAAVTTWGRPL